MENKKPDNTISLSIDKPEIEMELFQANGDDNPFYAMMMMFPALPIVKLNITFCNLTLAYKKVELLETKFKWNKRVPLKDRDIDLSELNDPLGLYGEWIAVKKEKKMWVLGGEFVVSNEDLIDGDIYQISGIMCIVVNKQALTVMDAKYKTRKDIPKVVTGEVDAYFHAHTFTYVDDDYKTMKFEPRITE